ncbi:MAG TPA: hypothetical protein VH575_30785 [Gemmataceae bacterium]|jgi:hypothetical protein
MTTESSRFVPKVHPANRPVEAEDPLSLHAISLEGDPELMLHCVVQEYAWMGWGSEQILSLFRDPFYPALRELWDRYGEANLRERIARLIQQTGIFHFQVTIREEPEPKPEEAEPELVELGIPAQWRVEGGDHA